MSQTITAHWLQDFTFVGKTDSHKSVVMDSPTTADGEKIAPSPMDMVLFGLTGCAGIDVNPALTAQGADAVAIAQALKDTCLANGGSVAIPADIKNELRQIAKLLNIAWLSRGIEKDARLICPRSGSCPRTPSCHGADR